VQRGGEHDLLVVAPQADGVVVDVLDGVAVELAADLGQDVGVAAAVEQQRLPGLGHHPDDAERDPGRRRGRWRGDRRRGRWRRRGCRRRGRGVLGARERGEQGEREHTGDEAHGSGVCNP
jgi:hypothetical protein